MHATFVMPRYLEHVDTLSTHVDIIIIKWENNLYPDNGAANWSLIQYIYWTGLECLAGK